MRNPRTLSWRRAQALRKKQRNTGERKALSGRKFLWRRRDKLFLRLKEGYTALHDDWSDEP